MIKIDSPQDLIKFASIVLLIGIFLFATAKAIMKLLGDNIKNFNERTIHGRNMKFFEQMTILFSDVKNIVGFVNIFSFIIIAIAILLLLIGLVMYFI